MDQKLKSKIEAKIKPHQPASLATIKDGKPWVRYVMTTGDGLNLYINTDKQSRKVAQIEKNADVHVVLGFAGDMKSMEYVQVEGTATILTDKKIKEKMWVDYLSQFFKSPEDPSYVVIKISPTLIEFYETGEKNPQILKLG